MAVGTEETKPKDSAARPAAAPKLLKAYDDD
jgi:hypothetical protein